MNSYAIRGGIGLIAVVGFLVFHFMNKSSASGDYRRRAHAIIVQIDGYSAKPDYFDWLADEGHDKVFDGAYRTERRGRYSEKAWVDQGQYMDELFDWMIAQARTDNAPAVVEALTKYHNEHPYAGRAK